MKHRARLQAIERKLASRPAPADPVAQWRKTLIDVAKVYGSPDEVATYQAMTDDEIRQEWSRVDEQIDKIYSMTDEQLEEFLATDQAERQQLAQMSDEQLQAIVDAGTAEAKRKQNNQQ